jgi:hypothetical protein
MNLKTIKKLFTFSSSCWSRWLRALLTEAPNEEMVNLDFFEPKAFGQILNYMYGKPLPFSIEVLQHIFKIKNAIFIKIFLLK